MQRKIYLTEHLNLFLVTIDWSGKRNISRNIFQKEFPICWEIVTGRKIIKSSSKENIVWRSREMWGDARRPGGSGGGGRGGGGGGGGGAGESGWRGAGGAGGG